MFNNNPSLTIVEAGIDAAWAKQQVHTHNLVNVDTPYYKATEINFASTLKSMISDIAKDGQLTPHITTRGGTFLRGDQNNVDAEYENGELYKAYVQYNMLINKASGHFEKLATVNNANM